MRSLVTCALLLAGSAVFAQTMPGGTQQLEQQLEQQLPQQVQRHIPGQAQPGSPYQTPQGTMATRGAMCGQIGGQANVTVENTPDGAIIRMQTRDPSQVTQVQQMAQRIQSCMSPVAR